MPPTLPRPRQPSLWSLLYRDVFLRFVCASFAAVCLAHSALKVVEVLRIRPWIWIRSQIFSVLAIPDPDLGPVYSGIVTPLQGGLGDGFAGVRRGQWLHGARHQRRRPRPRLQPERRRRWPRERRRRRVQGTEFNAVRSSILNRHSVK